jgi:hypothetical protein
MGPDDRQRELTEARSGMNLTVRARQMLDSYLDEVQRSLSGRGDLDAADVVAGIREHVETELTVRSVDPATAEDVSDVLARLGPPDSLGGDDPAELAPVPRSAFLSALALVGIGIALLATDLQPLGWVILVLGMLGARWTLTGEGSQQSPEGRLVGAAWQAAAVCAAFAALAAPAVVVWGQAQIGGVLVGPLTARLELIGETRPASYWMAAASLAGLATGIWWLLLALLTTWQRDRLRRVLGPAAWILQSRSSRNLLIAGALLSLVSLLGGLL